VAVVAVAAAQPVVVVAVVVVVAKFSLAMPWLLWPITLWLWELATQDQAPLVDLVRFWELVLVYQHKVEAAAVLLPTAPHLVMVPMAEPRLDPAAADQDAMEHQVWEPLLVVLVLQSTVMVEVEAVQAQQVALPQTLVEQATAETEHFLQFQELLHTTEQVVVAVLMEPWTKLALVVLVAAAMAAMI